MPWYMKENCHYYTSHILYKLVSLFYATRVTFLDLCKRPFGLSQVQNWKRPILKRLNCFLKTNERLWTEENTKSDFLWRNWALLSFKTTHMDKLCWKKHKKYEIKVDQGCRYRDRFNIEGLVFFTLNRIHLINLKIHFVVSSVVFSRFTSRQTLLPSKTEQSVVV